MNDKRRNFFLVGMRRVGLPSSAPTAAMGWRESWITWQSSLYQAAQATAVTADGQAVYDMNGLLGVVANSYFRQATEASRPLYKTGGAGGKSYLYFDGSNDYMASLAASNFLAVGAKTILLAATIRTGWANVDKCVWDSGAIVGVMSGTGNMIKMRNWPGEAYVDSAGSAFVDNTPFVFACKHDGGKLYDTVNGVSWTTGVNSGNSTSLAGFLWIGASTYQWMDLYALAVANVVVSDENLTLCVNYFKKELGIA